MRRRIHFLAALAALAMGCGPVLAQEPAPAAKDAPASPRVSSPPPMSEELRALHQLVEKQSKQIDELTRQVEKLTAAVEAGKAVTKVEPAPKAEAEPAPDAPATPAETEDPTANAPKAEPAGGPKHIIQKGETLTSIAKHYNIPLVDLQKANKDLNPAKLQIGQTINVPAVKSPEPSPDKKENR